MREAECAPLLVLTHESRPEGIQPSASWGKGTHGETEPRLVKGTSDLPAMNPETSVRLGTLRDHAHGLPLSATPASA